jgi:hypothetical protein
MRFLRCALVVALLGLAGIPPSQAQADADISGEISAECFERLFGMRARIEGLYAGFAQQWRAHMQARATALAAGEAEAAWDAQGRMLRDT